MFSNSADGSGTHFQASLHVSLCQNNYKSVVLMLSLGGNRVYRVLG